MAIFGKTGSRGVLLALTMSACLARYALAGEIVSKNPATPAVTPSQPATEVFDVKTKEIPASGKVAAGADIPPPDFREFEDDKFINNLLGDDAKKAAKPSAQATPRKEPEPEKVTVPAPAVTTPPAVSTTTDKAVVSTPAVDNAKKTDVKEPLPAVLPPVSPTPDATATATPPASPTAPATDTVIAPPLPSEVASPPAPADAVQTPLAKPDEIIAATPADNSKNKDALTEEDKKTYVDLKKHLLNFIASSGGKAVVAENNDTATPDAAIQTTATNAKPTEAPATDATAPATPAAPASTTKPDDKAIAAKSPAADDFTDFLEPDAKKTDTTKPAVAATPAPVVVPSPEIKAPVVAENTPNAKTPDKKIETPAAPAPVAPALISTDIKNAAPTSAAPTKTAKATDVVTPLPPKKIDEEKIDNLNLSAPEEHEKLSDADKAYLKLLDKQRESLPESKKLSTASIKAIEGFSAALAPVKKGSKKEPTYIKIEHGKSGEPGKEEDGVIKSQSKMDISIRKAGKSDDFEKSKVKLDKAYKALLVGQNAAAISIYKEVLDKEPKNKDAMFGLATAYHKNSQFEQARDIYTKILKANPSDKEALNNFLVLVAEEAPEDALIELEKLERINSNFSPIAAQIAMINLRMGNPEKAARYLRRAILLSPENISYKYNLAVVYDKAGKEEQALPLYRQVVEASNGGEAIPGSIDKITQRMNYLEKKVAEKK